MYKELPEGLSIPAVGCILTKLIYNEDCSKMMRSGLFLSMIFLHVAVFSHAAFFSRSTSDSSTADCYRHYDHILMLGTKVMFTVT